MKGDAVCSPCMLHKSLQIDCQEQQWYMSAHLLLVQHRMNHCHHLHAKEAQHRRHAPFYTNVCSGCGFHACILGRHPVNHCRFGFFPFLYRLCSGRFRGPTPFFAFIAIRLTPRPFFFCCACLLHPLKNVCHNHMRH